MFAAIQKVNDAQKKTKVVMFAQAIQFVSTKRSKKVAKSVPRCLRVLSSELTAKILSRVASRSVKSPAVSVSRKVSSSTAH